MYVSSIKVVGTSISLANNFRVDGNSPFDFIGTKKSKLLSTCRFGPFCDKEGISEEV